MRKLSNLCARWARRLLSMGRAATTPRGAVARRVRPSLEALETRLVPSSGDWSMYNFDVAGTRDNTAEKILSPANVGGLQVLWNFPTAGVVAGTPAVVHDA